MRNKKADTLLEALPYFQQFRGRTVVIKYGGAAMESPELVDSVMRDIVFLEAVGINPVVVHGGGKAITAAMRHENSTARFVDGHRVTDEASIKIIDRILTEEISPSLAAKIQEFGGKAEVLSGKEVLVAEKRRRTWMRGRQNRHGFCRQHHVDRHHRCRSSSMRKSFRSFHRWAGAGMAGLQYQCRYRGGKDRAGPEGA